MTEEDLYKNVVLSLTRFIEDFRAANMPKSAYINWDEHANISELPQSDVIGMAGIGLSEDVPKHYEVVFGVMISTWGDKGLHRLTDLMSKLRAKLKPKTRLQVYRLSDDKLSAVASSWIVTTTPQAILPVSKAEIRSVQALELRALLDPSATSSLV